MRIAVLKTLFRKIPCLGYAKFLLEKCLVGFLDDSRWRGLALKRTNDCIREAVIKRSKGPLKDKFSNKPLTSFILLVSWRKERKNKKKRRHHPLNIWIVFSFDSLKLHIFLRELFVFDIPFKFLNIALNPPSSPFIKWPWYNDDLH